MALRPILAAAGVLLALAPASASASGATAQIVIYNDVSNPSAETQTRERDLGFTATQRYRRVVEGFAARLTAQQIESLRQDPEVAQVVPDRPVHADSTPLAPGGTLPVGISRIWAQSGGSIRAAAGVAVAVIDTGIDLSNPDLNVDPAQPGKNCMPNRSNYPPQDDHGHGTHVAGTIAARNDGSGVVGVAPGTRLYTVKVLDAQGAGSWSDIICGLDWVRQNADALGIKVVNMSLGGDGSVGSCASRPEHNAICKLVAAGVTVVAAAGNDGKPLTSGESAHVPAAYPEVLTVTAMADTDGLPGGAGPGCKSDPDDTFASFSNFGSAGESGHIIAAPGGCVVSLAVGGGLQTLSGTSMATPHVAGAAALCITEGATPGPCSGLSPAGVISTLRATAEAGATATNGFAGDPLHPNGHYFGYLVRAAVPPVATTGDATPGDTQATLGGTIDPGGQAATWWFELGPSTAYGQSTPQQAVPAGPAPGAVQTVGTGLDPGTSYHYRLVLHVGEWTVRGADRTLKTTGTPPPETQIDMWPATRTASGHAELGFSALPATGATFECRLDTDVWYSCESPDKPDVAEGIHKFSVRAIGPGGIADKTPASVTWTVDLTPPDTFIVGAPANPTTSARATFGIGSNESPTTLQCRLDNGDWVGCSTPWEVTALAAGPHRFEARAIDAVGWVDPTPAGYEWSVVGSGATAPSSSGETPGSAGFVTDAPGAALLPVSRLATVGPARIDRKRGRVDLLIVCRGPGPCTGRLEIAIRGLRVAGGPIQLAAGARKHIGLALARGSGRALRAPTPRTASLSLIQATRTKLENAWLGLLTDRRNRG
jgi:subtilisin family serine protease